MLQPYPASRYKAQNKKLKFGLPEGSATWTPPLIVSLRPPFCLLADADINVNAFTAATHQSLTKAPLAFKLSHSVATPEGPGRIP